jgi:predicted nucleic acid-binding protein
MKSGDIICDSSSLISLADSCLLPTLKTIKEHLDGKIYISKRVEYESILHPMEIPEYALAALRLRQAVKDGIITLVDTRRAAVAMREIMGHANRTYTIAGRPMRIIQEGEAEMLALAQELGIPNILMDERTTRMLSEAPEEMRAHYEKEFGKEVRMNDGEVSWFRNLTRGMRVFRSSEIAVAAYEFGHFKEYGDMETKMLEASLYALKFNGCGISFEEIQEFMADVGSRSAMRR